MSAQRAVKAIGPSAAVLGLALLLGAAPAARAAEAQAEGRKTAERRAEAAKDLTAWPLSVAAVEQAQEGVPGAVLGTDPRVWRERLASAAGRLHAEVLPGVDLLYSGTSERLVAVLVVHGGADARAVSLGLPARTGFESDGRGHAVVRLEGGDVALLRPGVVQAGRRTAVAAAWTDGGDDQARLALGGYDTATPLLVRFEVLFLAEWKDRLDRNRNGRVDLDEVGLPAPPSPLGGPTVTASKEDSFTSDGGAPGQADPGDELKYTVTVGVTGSTATGMAFDDAPDSSTTLVPGSVNVSPLARDDVYDAVGNVTLSVPSAAQGIFQNDTEFLGDTFTLTSPTPGVPTATTGGGSVTVQADGTFTYTTPPGASSGTDSFTYTIADGSPLTGTGTVTFTIAGRVWFVDVDAPAGGNGSQANPFNALTASTVAGTGGAGDVDGPGDYIYLFDRAAATDYPAGLELEPLQRLVGSGVALVVGSTTVLPGGTPPTLANAAGNGVTLSTDTQVRGLTIAAANDSGILAGGSLGTSSVESSVSLVTSGSGTGITVSNVQSPQTVGFAGSISGTGSGPAVSISGQDGSLSFASASLVKTAGKLIEVVNKTGGTVSFAGATITGGAGEALLVQNNSGATQATFSAPVAVTTTGGGSAVKLQSSTGTTAFNGGLTVNAGNGVGLFANAGGTLTIAGTSNTLSATGGAALDITGTTFGGGATFASVSSTNSGATGVSLVSVAGALTMNGGAISGSAGTAFNVSGGSSGVSYAGTISKANAGRAVDVQGRVGGTVTLGGAITATGSTTGINVSGAGAASTVAFNGAVDLGTSGTRLTGGTALTVSHNGTGSTTSFADLDVFTNGQQGIDAGNGGTLSVATGQVDALGGRALNLSALGLGVTFSNVSSASSTTQGINLATCTGTLNMAGGTITGSSGTALNVSGGSPTVTYGGSVTQNNAQRVVDIQSTAGGAITIATATGGASSTGVNINAANGSVTFTNLNLGASASRMTSQAVTINGGTGTYRLGSVSIFATGATAKGISALNADGTLNSIAGTVDSVGAPAIDIDGPAGITTLGMSLTKVSANGGPYGLRVQDTSGTFVVTGDGGGSNNGSGGTITGMAGADQATAADLPGNGVYLSNAAGVSLGYMNITSNQNSGLFGAGATNFSMARSNVQDNGNSAGTALNEAGLRFLTLKGTCSISDTLVSGSVEDNVRLSATSDVLTELTITSGTIGPNSAATGNNGLGVFGAGTAQMTVKVNGTSFPTNKARGIVGNATDTAKVTMELTGVSVSNSTGGLDFTTELSGDLTFKVLGGSSLLFNGQLATSAVNVVSSTDATNASDFKGRFEGNSIGNASVDSGSIDNFGVAQDIRGDVTALMAVNGNTIQHTDWEGVFVQTRLDNDPDAEIGHLDLELRDNTVGTMDDGGGGFPQITVYGTRIESRNTSNMCLDIFSNASTGLGGFEHFRTRQRDTSTFRAERLALGAQSAATMQAHVAAQNDPGSTASATAATNYTGVADGACLTAP